MSKTTQTTKGADDKQFLAFVEDIKRLASTVEGCDADFEVLNYSDGKTASFTFYATQEHLVDALIRTARKTLLSPNPIDLDKEKDGNKYTYCVYKSFIISHRYWALDFCLSERYSLTENYQP